MEIVKFLGEGSFGSVHLVKFKEPDGTSKYSAMKSSNWWNFESLNKEIQILSKLRGCPRIVQSFGDALEEAFTTDGHKVYRMFLEYAAGGTLEALMDKHVDQRLPDRMIRQFTRMILGGIVSIHSRGYVHCDLKPENVLVFPLYVRENGVWSLSYEVKISDFGLSRETGESDDWWDPNSPFWGTPLYMSPESVNEGKIGKALDIWSLGCIVLEMYTGQPPWPYEDVEEIMNVLRHGDAPKIPDTLPWAARQFLETCFARNPEERGNALGLLAHQFLRGDESEPGNDPKPLRLKIIPPRPPVRSKNSIPPKPRKLKIVPPRPLKLKSIPQRPLRLKIIPPRPPGTQETFGLLQSQDNQTKANSSKFPSSAGISASELCDMRSILQQLWLSKIH